MAELDTETDGALRLLIDEYRARCLWFLRPDYYPRTSEEATRVLGWIRRHGDLAASPLCRRDRAMALTRFQR